MPAGLYRSFVDAGAFVGDTLAAYRRRFGDAFDNYYVFEPDPGHFSRLSRSAGGDSRIECRRCLLFDRKTRLSFKSDGMMSGASDTGDEGIEADTLDAILSGRTVTCIKADVEGLEPELLAGAEGIVSAQRPGLAISAYHRPEHLWELPLWMKRVNPGYRLYLRHHSVLEFETVCYAVPGGEG
jgi:FkbM family methyltransferase